MFLYTENSIFDINFNFLNKYLSIKLKIYSKIIGNEGGIHLEKNGRVCNSQK
jgi:hypothetical protein